MENILQKSVARVLGSEGSSSPFGTAFLFAKADEEQFWMTCHHVIRTLPAVKLAVYANNALTEIDCQYCPELSSPMTDVAVFKTNLSRNTCSSLDLVVLPFGDLSTSDGYPQWELIGCGMQMSMGQFQGGLPFSGKFSNPQDGIYEAADDDTTTCHIQNLKNPWNIPFVARSARLYEFCDETSRLEPGFSGSPICIRPRSIHDIPMCVGMLRSRRVEGGTLVDGRVQGGDKFGYVIPFDEINKACPNTLPFYRFASCVVVILAAKRGELESVNPELGAEFLNRLPNYHNTSRDEWHPFKITEPPIKDLLRDLPRGVPSLQLASSFLDDCDGAFLEYLKEPHMGPLVYVIDPCSMNVDAIQEVAKHVSNHYRGAHYIYALCDTIGAETRQQLKDKVKQYLGGQFWEYPHRSRLEPAEDLYAFGNRVREGVRKACEQFIRQFHLEVGSEPSPHFDWSDVRRR